ncbi:hypothetical protein [Novosphingobium guangzhouense]|uniref:Terminase n=1 Tax=Novosphingobium guangzhouense TaxID=1850347 RepID=A0A2K2FT78_9SPHN|nr:hypothetical protein [Novosphingobium guangzhouense]PNU01999.1 hypothetical protein A8V01_11160 [Novosphingobium guangzhouense]
MSSPSPDVSHTAWDADRKVRFLDQLSQKGDVRAACAFVGMSRTSAYLLRRRDAVFADAWTAALVLARRHVEEVLATRALDGVEEAVWFRGELVGVRRRYDSRLLLAHLARLDAAGEGHEALAGRFDEALALVAGEDPRADVPDARLAAGQGAALPPEREDYIAETAGAGFVAAREQWLDAVDAINAAAGYVPPLDDEDARADCGGAQAGASAPDYPAPPGRSAFLQAGAARWDGWQARAFARVDDALFSYAFVAAGNAAPMEYKSLEGVWGEGPGEGPGEGAGVAAMDRVNRVNLLAADPRVSSAQEHGSAKVSRGRERLGGVAVIACEGRRGSSPTPLPAAPADLPFRKVSLRAEGLRAA